MRSLWITVSCLALAHLLALGAFVGWLHTTGRLNTARVERLREIFAPTLAQEAAHRAAEEAKAQEHAAALVQAAHQAVPPVAAARQVSEKTADADVQQARIERVKREVEDLRRTLALERADLDARQTAFDRRVAEFDAMRARLQKQEGEEQFRKAVELYASLPAAKAQELLQTLVDAGDTEQVVAYLNRMETRTARKIIEKFPDPKMAADLLERLRTLGVEAHADEPP